MEGAIGELLGTVVGTAGHQVRAHHRRSLCRASVGAVEKVNVFSRPDIMTTNYLVAKHQIVVFDCFDSFVGHRRSQVVHYFYVESRPPQGRNRLAQRRFRNRCGV